MPAIFSANSDSTWYGVARSPYTTRFANRCARRRSGWKSSAIATTAIVVSSRIAHAVSDERPDTDDDEHVDATEGGG